MKKIYLYTLATIALCAFGSCNKDLPYPIDEVKKGVLVDIVRVAGTDGVLAAGQTGGNYKIKLTIPQYQGDYSFLDRVQLLAVLERNNATSSRVVVDNITTFPQEITIDVADVYSKFGLTAPTLGEVLYLTTNAVLNTGEVIPGWTEYAGFNNRAFTGWKVDGRNYSFNVRYPVACPLDINNFIGTMMIDDEWWEDTYAVTVTKISDNELSVSGLFQGYVDHDLIITIDFSSHTVSVAKQVLVDDTGIWGWPYTGFALAGSGTINACDNSISFTAAATVDQGSFGSYGFKIYK
jgi:hypothetical protein